MVRRESRWKRAGARGRPIREHPYPYAFRDFDLQLRPCRRAAYMKIDVPSGEAYVPHAYLYQFGNTQPVEDVRLSAATGQPGSLAARFTSAVEGPAYTVSLGIFDPSGALKKWFNNIGAFAISGGALTTPQLDTLTMELGCSTMIRRSRPHRRTARLS